MKLSQKIQSKVDKQKFVGHDNAAVITYKMLEEWIDDAVQLEQNCIKHDVMQARRSAFKECWKRPSAKLFCKVHSAMFGEQIDNHKQLINHSLSGDELYELCLAFHQAACATAKGEERKE